MPPQAARGRAETPPAVYRSTQPTPLERTDMPERMKQTGDPEIEEYVSPEPLPIDGNGVIEMIPGGFQFLASKRGPALMQLSHDGEGRTLLELFDPDGNLRVQLMAGTKASR